MNVPAPHYLLYSEAARRDADQPAGRWRFVLRDANSGQRLEAGDEEPEGSTERLELLAIVRGLEALDEPARVTLVAAGRSIGRGLKYGLAQWRESDWQWERFGRLAPIKNGDLWRRIDRAMAIHQVECRDAAAAADDLAAPPASARKPADVRIIQRRGRKLRIDRPAARHEIRSTKQETNSKHPCGNGRRFGHSKFWHWNLPGISDFVLRILTVR
jgi:ribonuclease HI